MPPLWTSTVIAPSPHKHRFGSLKLSQEHVQPHPQNMHPWHFHSKPPMTRPVGRHCRRPAARASPCREASPPDKWLLIKHAPVGVQHDLVDFALVASERSGDGPRARDIAGVAVQLAPRIHQQQLPLVHPLRAFNTGLISRVPSEHVRPAQSMCGKVGLRTVSISAGGT